MGGRQRCKALPQLWQTGRGLQVGHSPELEKDTKADSASWGCEVAKLLDVRCWGRSRAWPRSNSLTDICVPIGDVDSNRQRAHQGAEIVPFLFWGVGGRKERRRGDAKKYIFQYLNCCEIQPSGSSQGRVAAGTGRLMPKTFQTAQPVWIISLRNSAHALPVFVESFHSICDS